MQITNKKLKHAVLTALDDDLMLKIINFTKQKSKSPVEIIKKFDISYSTAYRKINWLLDNGLLLVERTELRDDGKKYSLLRSTIKSVKINYEDNEVNVEVTENIEKLSLSAKQFFSLGDEN